MIVRDALGIYLVSHSYSEGSNLISVKLFKNNVAAFEEQLRPAGPVLIIA